MRPSSLSAPTLVTDAVSVNVLPTRTRPEFSPTSPTKVGRGLAGSTVIAYRRTVQPCWSVARPVPPMGARFAKAQDAPATCMVLLTSKTNVPTVLTWTVRFNVSVSAPSQGQSKSAYSTTRYDAGTGAHAESLTAMPAGNSR